MLPSKLWLNILGLLHLVAYRVRLLIMTLCENASHGETHFSLRRIGVGHVRHILYEVS